MSHGQNSTVSSCPRPSIFASSWPLRLSSGSIENPALHQRTPRALLGGTGGRYSKTPSSKAMFTTPSANIALEMVGNDKLIVN